ncbi:hypothetical protein [Methylosinus sp. C49]|nr:hypothetical protein [Methylosinus sp. C49]
MLIRFDLGRAAHLGRKDRAIMGSFVDNVLNLIFGSESEEKVLEAKVFRLFDGSVVRFEIRTTDRGGPTVHIRCDASRERVDVPLDDAEVRHFRDFGGRFAADPGRVPELEDYNSQHFFQIIRGCKPIRMRTDRRGAEPVFCFCFAFEMPHVYALDAAQCAEMSAFLSGCGAEQ